MNMAAARVAGTTSDFLPELRLGFENLRAHKLRSLLTMMGMIFGVAAVVAMLSIGAGAQQEVMAFIEQQGSGVHGSLFVVNIDRRPTVLVIVRCRQHNRYGGSAESFLMVFRHFIAHEQQPVHLFFQQCVDQTKLFFFLFIGIT